MNFIRSLLFAALITGIGVTNAAPVDFSLMNFPDLSISKSHRIEAAKRIQHECSRILALVPRLSPTEDEWLKGEINAKRDFENLMRRSEYARHGLYVHFSDCVAQSRLAAEQSSGKERSIAWARLASRFSSELDLVYWAEKVGNADLQESVKRFAAWEKLENYMIIDEIVLPYIMHSKE